MKVWWLLETMPIDAQENEEACFSFQELQRRQKSRVSTDKGSLTFWS